MIVDFIELGQRQPMFTRFADSKHHGIICFNPVLCNLLTELTELIERESVNDSHSRFT